MLPEKIIYIGVLLNLIGATWYIKTIIHDGTKPNLVSWFLWMLAPFVGVFLQIKAGAGLSFLGTFMAGFCPLTVIIFTLIKRNAIWKITTFDIVCGSFSLLALVLYILTNKLGISIFFAILSDALAAIPTIRKAWKFPETETSFTYMLGIINHILALLIIRNWIFSIYAFSAYFMLMNLTIIFSIYHKKIYRTKNLAEVLVK
jgi:hypothetical protein